MNLRPYSKHKLRTTYDCEAVFENYLAFIADSGLPIESMVCGFGGMLVAKGLREDTYDVDLLMDPLAFRVLAAEGDLSIRSSGTHCAIDLPQYGLEISRDNLGYNRRPAVEIRGLRFMKNETCLEAYRFFARLKHHANIGLLEDNPQEPVTV